MLKYSIYTNAGDRPVNEDSVGYFEKGDKQCFVLCDGLGGHGMGDVASKIVKNTVGQQFERADRLENFVGEALSTAQSALMQEQIAQSAQQKMKTTSVMLATDEDNAYVGHIGDSRLYVFRKNKVLMRTLDHSVPQMLVLSKKIKESQIRNHPDRNLVLRVMGVEWEEPKYELETPIPLKKCQAFLMCSDGFWELIEEKEMCRLLKKSDTVEEWILEMSEIVKQNGKGRNMDNFSAIAVWK